MNQRIGYARVSTNDLQRDALTRAGCGVIYKKTASGKNAAHPELDQCKTALWAGYPLVVWQLNRLGRSLPDLVQNLKQQGVGFESLMEKIETSSAAGNIGVPCVRSTGRVRTGFDQGADASQVGCRSRLRSS